jgi:hypothetical protein
MSRVGSDKKSRKKAARIVFMLNTVKASRSDPSPDIAENAEPADWIEDAAQPVRIV